MSESRATCEHCGEDIIRRGTFWIHEDSGFNRCFAETTASPESDEAF